MARMSDSQKMAITLGRVKSERERYKTERDAARRRLDAILAIMSSEPDLAQRLAELLTEAKVKPKKAAATKSKGKHPTLEVTIPEAQAEGTWCRLVTGIVDDRRGGAAFSGPFLKPGLVRKLRIGTVLVYAEPQVVRVYVVDLNVDDGLREAASASRSDEEWADQIKPEVAPLLAEQSWRVEDGKQRVIEPDGKNRADEAESPAWPVSDVRDERERMSHVVRVRLPEPDHLLLHILDAAKGELQGEDLRGRAEANLPIGALVLEVDHREPPFARLLQVQDYPALDEWGVLTESFSWLLDGAQDRSWVDRAQEAMQGVKRPAAPPPDEPVEVSFVPRPGQVDVLQETSTPTPDATDVARPATEPEAGLLPVVVEPVEDVQQSNVGG